MNNKSLPTLPPRSPQSPLPPPSIGSVAAEQLGGSVVISKPKSLNRKNLKDLSLPTADNSPLKEPKSLTRKNLKQLSLLAPTPAPPAATPLPDLLHEMMLLTLKDGLLVTLCDKDLVELKKLGAGNSGMVSKVLHMPLRRVMAKKTIRIEAKPAVHKQIVRELRIMHECLSPYIIGFVGLYLHELAVIILMEYVDCGLLDKILKLVGPFPEPLIRHMCWLVASGLIYLYEEHKIIHRDVKPSNVLMTLKGEMKLCDFGVSRELTNSLADTFVGTSVYMSPERIQGGNYSVKSDVWSLGLMVVELATGSSPLGESSADPEGILDLLQSIINEAPPKLDRARFSLGMCNFVDCCLCKEEERSSPRDLLEHGFMAGMLRGVDKEVRVWAKMVRAKQTGRGEVTAPPLA